MNNSRNLESRVIKIKFLKTLIIIIKKLFHPALYNFRTCFNIQYNYY